MKPGQVIHGRYEVQRELASGGMATVYVARHTALDSLHAVKLLHLPSPEIRERLLLEGRLQARLRHPNIVAVSDILNVEQAPALVMELIEGPALDEWLEEHRPTLQEAEQLFLGILAGVDHAHRHGVVHRDLKPANVLLAPMPGGFQPKVTDFGIAKVIDEVLESKGGRVRTRTGMGMGTPAYMAPEQIQGASSVGPAADIFALGSILYELIIGRPAFQGPTFVEILSAARDGAYDDPADVCPDLPVGMVQAIRGALAPSVSDRIADCTTLARVLTGGRVATLSGIGPVLAEEPLELPSRAFPRGSGSRPGSTQGGSRETFLPEGEPPAAESEPLASEPPPPRELHAGPVDPPVTQPEPPSSAGSTYEPEPPSSAGSTYEPEPDDPSLRRRDRFLVALFFLIAAGVVGLGVVALILIIVGVIGVTASGVAALESSRESRAAEPEEVVATQDPPLPPAETSGDSVSSESDSAPEIAQSEQAEPEPEPELIEEDAPAPPAPTPSEKGSSSGQGSSSPAPGPASEPTPPVRSGSEPVATTTPGTATSAGDTTEAPVRSTTSPSPARSGRVGSAGGFRVEVRGTRSASETSRGVFERQAGPGRVLYFVDVAVQNDSGRGASPTAPFTLEVAGGTVETDMRCRLATDNALAAVPELPAGRTVSGLLCFDVPARSRPVALVFRPGRGAEAVRVPLR